jgi:hypothetical protein
MLEYKSQNAPLGERFANQADGGQIMNNNLFGNNQT